MLYTLSLSQAQLGLKKRDFSATELTQSCLTRIETTDSQLNAFVTINQSALKAAQTADKAIKKDPDIFNHAPLTGIPVAIKDNFLTSGIETTASSRVLKNFVPVFDATVVAKLKNAGIVILGKTNMDAWAHGSSTETSDYGPTKNPWDSDRLPGGSSGGSAAAVAANQCIFAIGSETAGSIRQPAAWCGITGMKPTYGRVSRYGVVAMASSTDSPGPMTKTVEDSHTVLEIISGTDSYDATTIQSSWQTSSAILNRPISNLKIGLPQAYLLAEMAPEVKDVILKAAQTFESLGATLVDVSLMDPHYAIGVYTILQRSEVSSNLARYDGIRYGQDRSFFGSEAKRRMMLGTYSLSTGYYDEYYKKAQKVRTLIVKDFNQAFTKCDLIIGPTSPGPALKVGASLDQPMFGEMEDILVEASSIAGLTSINVPCGFVEGLPIGMQITAPQGQENLVFNAAQQFQQATSWHTQKPPLTPKGMK